METEYEIVSINRISDSLVRVGLAPVGRIAQYTQRAQDPAMLGIVGADLTIDWPASDQPATGEVITAAFARKVS